jgi:hypothetical protein
MRTFAAVLLGGMLVAPVARAQQPSDPASQPGPGPAEPAPPGQYPPPPPRAPAQGSPPAGYGAYPPSGYGAYPSNPGPYPGASPYYPPPPAEPYGIRRGGLVLGFALGGGGINFQDGSDRGFAYSFDIGGMLNNNMALMFDVSGLSHAVSSFEEESHSIFGGVLRVFFLRFLWAQAGIGLGELSTSDGWGYTTDSTGSALAGIFGAGAEVLQTTSGFSLDLQLRVAGARYGSDVGRVINTSFLIGLNFY